MSRAESRRRSYGSTRGRPRSKAVEQAILEAVLMLLEDGVPLAELSVESIARTAGVGKAAIYRRWSDKEDLFVDVIRAAEPAERELPGTSMRDDLVVLLESLRQRSLALLLVGGPAHRTRPDEKQPEDMGRLPLRRDHSPA